MATHMKLAACCCTYKRPRELGNAIACFLAQDYPADRIEMIVLDDAGQYDPYFTLGGINNVHVVSTRRRFKTLGEKRNACAALASPDVEALLVWDDDDGYLPSHASVVAEALEDHDFVRPQYVYTERAGGVIRLKEAGGLFHGAWGVRVAAFDAVRGYPHMQSGQDQALARVLAEAGVRHRFYDTPAYVYRWQVTKDQYHISAMGARGYERLEERTGRFVGQPPVAVFRDYVAATKNACASSR